MSKLVLQPLTLREANAFVEMHHRHSRPTRGHRFAVGATLEAELQGVAIVGRPLARAFHPTWVAEVTRLCVGPDAPKGACSFLYAACWRSWRAMGGRRLVTYTLQCESGASLRGAGWRRAAELNGRDNGAWQAHDRERDMHASYGMDKLRWEVSVAQD